VSEVEAARAARTPSHPLVERGLLLARRRDVQRAAALLVVTLSVGTLALLVAWHWDEIRGASWRLEPARLTVGLLLQAAAIGIDALIWVDISHRLGATWDPRRDVRVYAYSLLARRLPGAVWHVVGRAAFYADAGLGRRVGVAGSAIEVGLLVLTGVGIALLFFPEAWPFGAIVGALLLAVGPLFVRPGMRMLLRRPATWLPPASRIYLWVVLYVTSWLVGCVGAFLQFDALYPLDPWFFPRLVWAMTGSIVASAAVVVVPGGLGVREVGMTALMGDDVPRGVAATLAVAHRVAIALIEVAWSLGVILLLRPRRARGD
jgi:hypothetical protein